MVGKKHKTVWPASCPFKSTALIKTRQDNSIIFSTDKSSINSLPPQVAKVIQCRPVDQIVWLYQIFLFHFPTDAVRTTALSTMSTISCTLGSEFKYEYKDGSSTKSSQKHSIGTSGQPLFTSCMILQHSTMVRCWESILVTEKNPDTVELVWIWLKLRPQTNERFISL